MFYKSDENGYTEVLTGITVKSLVYGDKTLFTEFRMKGGNCLPSHSHPHEQTGYLVKGRLLLTIGDTKELMNPGDCWCIKGDVAHGAEILDDSIAIEVFSPVREDYLKYLKSRG